MSAIIKAIVAALAEAFFNFLWSKKNEIIEIVDDTKTEWTELDEVDSDDIVNDDDK